MPIPTDHAKPVRQSAKENAFKQLQQWIIDGTLLPGEKLNDTDLAQALSVSRTPIRESLQLLEVQGFVKMYPGKATQVTEIDREAIKDLLPPLASLQALSAELAISHISDETIKLLESTNERFASAIHSKNFYAALKFDEDFHHIIVFTANNPYITKVIESLQAHVRRLFYHNSITLTEQSIDDHTKIISLLKQGDKENIALIMKENWLRTIGAFEEEGKS
ncbi:GntR family transcriptional regulator [Oceanobacillus arenosus]|uniref:GntR family transcriptional regulator n=1 Tax=Oceanobacillus arenosus TaxID=1229153 RepID=A0A3D8PSA9_9BACI|nr:GntR family transcriptional regulator [Oceanobacillus arenosus]RDW19006.1 GntR family transcriptional regulator [Oceanobacillus arenosus]